MKSPITSDRIQKPIAALRNAGSRGLTPIELNQICNSTRATSDLSECRQHGFPIEKTYDGTSANGRRVFRYRLAATPEQAHAAFDAAYADYYKNKPKDDLA